MLRPVTLLPTIFTLIRNKLTETQLPFLGCHYMLLVLHSYGVLYSMTQTDEKLSRTFFFVVDLASIDSIKEMELP